MHALYTMRHNHKGYKLVDTDTKFFLIIDIAEISCTNNCWEQGQRLCVNCLQTEDYQGYTLVLFTPHHQEFKDSWYLIIVIVERNDVNQIATNV